MYIIAILPINYIVRLSHLRLRKRQSQETFLVPSVDNQTHNYDAKCSNQPSLPMAKRD